MFNDVVSVRQTLEGIGRLVRFRPVFLNLCETAAR